MNLRLNARAGRQAFCTPAAVAALLSGLLSVILLGILWGPAPLLQSFTYEKGAWWLWRSAAAYHLRPALAFAALLAGVAGSVLSVQAFRRSASRRWAVLWPLTLAPLALIVGFYGDVLPAAWWASLLFYVPVLLLSLAIAPLLAPSPSGLPQPRARRFPVTAVIAAAALLYSLTGLYYTKCCGAHAGDEGHYLVLAESVSHDGDLDIRNNLEEDLGPAVVQELGHSILHVSPASRPPHWYSYHAPGLAFLLAPVEPYGIVARHIMLGLFAGLACGAIWLLCRRTGASQRSCVMALVAFGGGFYWCVYASRALPEVLGAALVAWLCWSIVAQKEFPWRTAFVALCCCVYLPWAQIRFFPLALTGLVLYVAYGWRTTEERQRRWLRLGFFLLAGVGGVVLYRSIQNQMYAGGFSHPVQSMLFSYPPGLWKIFTDPTGMLNLFPLAVWMCAATLVWFVVAPTQRADTFVPIALFGANWLATCAVGNYGGGATVGGRFLVVVMPLLLPPSAAVLDRATPAARWWFTFLALISVSLLVLQLLHLPQLGRSFAYPYQELPVVIHPLQALRTPFCGTAHALAILALTLALLVFRKRRPAVGMTALMLGLSVVWQLLRPDTTAGREPDRPQNVARALAAVDLERAWVSQAPEPNLSLFDISDFFWIEGRSTNLSSLTTRDLSVPPEDHLISQPRLPPNDFEGRRFRWMTLVAPFNPGKGQRVFHLRGTVEGTASPVLAVRQGSHTLLEKQLPVTADGHVDHWFTVNCTSRKSRLYLLLRLEGDDGSFHPLDLQGSPYSVLFMDQMHFAKLARFLRTD